MDQAMELAFEQSKTGDKDERYQSYQTIIAATDQEVSWAYEVWDQLIEDLSHKDNHQRSRASQYLAGLAKSDPDKRILADFPKIWQVTYDEKFVTARHTLQALWKIGIAGSEQKDMLLTYLSDRFKVCENEKNYTLIRNDIIQNMRNLYDYFASEGIKDLALELIETVDDVKYQKKYLKIWK